MRRQQGKIFFRANTLVEFALTAPLFFLMVWGLLDVARLETMQIIFRQHGHELARHLASSDVADPSLLEEESRRWSMAHGWNLSSVRVSIIPITVQQKPAPGRLLRVVERIRVDLNASFSPFSPLMLALHHVHPFHQHAVIEEVRVYANSPAS